MLPPLGKSTDAFSLASAKQDEKVEMFDPGYLTPSSETQPPTLISASTPIDENILPPCVEPVATSII